MIFLSNPPEDAVKQLLVAAHLPIADLSPAHFKHFFGAWDGSRLDGVVGIELLGSIGLLRSLAVVASKRGSGLGSALLTQIEKYAVGKGVRSVFLLTVTAEPFFLKRGYARTARAAAPESIQNTAEFANLCPASSILMMKPLGA